MPPADTVRTPPASGTASSPVAGTFDNTVGHAGSVDPSPTGTGGGLQRLPRIAREETGVRAAAFEKVITEDPDDKDEKNANRVSEEVPPGELPQAAERRSVQQIWNDLEPGHADETAPPVALDDVLLSVLETFPLIQGAMLEGDIAEGKRVSAWGEFDLKIKAEGLAAPQGYYQSYRNLVKVEQGTWNGGTVYGQYRIGDGDFPVWYGERETNEGGEFKAGIISPLMRGRRIDERRADILLAQLRQAQVEPAVQAQVLEATQLAARTYWSWVAAGQAYLAQRELLRVTRERNEGYRRRVELKDLPQIELQQNERLIASREAKLIEARRKLQQSAIKLSLFLRTPDGIPLVPHPGLLPERFPKLARPDPTLLESDVALALASRPEMRDIALQQQQAEIDLVHGENQLLPTLNATVEASQDVGRAASSKGDKSPFELEAGLLFDLPLQRRKAFGKVASAQGKISQIAVKQQFTENKIRAEIQDAYSALTAAYDRWEQAERSQQFARELETAERRRFELGDSDLLRVAIQESASIDAAILTIEAQSDFFQAEADYRAALAVTPLQ